MIWCTILQAVLGKLVKLGEKIKVDLSVRLRLLDERVLLDWDAHVREPRQEP